MFDSIYSIALDILNKVHGDASRPFDSNYAIALAILSTIGGDPTQPFDSVYSILKEIYRVRFGSALADMDSVYAIAEAINHALDDTDNALYDSTYSILLHVDENPALLGHKFSIITDSSNTVIINGRHTREDYFEEGDEVTWSVSKTGYVTQSGTYTMGDEDYELEITLVLAQFTATITPTPNDATVTINGVERSSFTADYGTTITWSVAKTGYYTQSGTFTLLDDTDLDVDLSITTFTFSIDTDSANTVIINGEERTSIVADYGTTITWSVSRDHYVTQSGTHTLTSDHTESVTLVIQKFTITIISTPADATVNINGNETTTLSNIPYGQTAVYYVSKTGYVTQSDRVVMTQDETINVSLVLEQHTFTIIPTPNDAVVTINGETRTSITADYGTTINWSVAKTGYTTQSGTETLTETYSMNVNLSVANHTFEIEATPNDATVVINGEERTSLTAPYGTAITWSVSKSHYITQTGSYTLTGDHYETVTLVADDHTFTIVPTPNDATVIINGQERTSLTAIHGTVATWSVAKTGYVTQSGTYTMNDDYTENVTLVVATHTVTITPTPADAVVEINGTAQSSLTANYGTTINWSVSKTGYVTQSGTFVLTGDTTLTPTLVLEQHTFTISATPNDATVTINGVERSTLTADYGTVITWSVAKTHYTTQSGTYTLTSDHTESVTLALQQFTYTINPTPADADVEINGVAQSSLTADYGTAISWEVSKTGYNPESGSAVLTEDHTENVTLTPSAAVITFDKNAADVKLVVNGEYLGTGSATHSVTVDPGTPIHWEAYKAGYATVKGDLIASSSQTVNISMAAAKFVRGTASSSPILNYYNGSYRAFTINYSSPNFYSSETSIGTGSVNDYFANGENLQKLETVRFEACQSGSFGEINYPFKHSQATFSQAQAPIDSVSWDGAAPASGVLFRGLNDYNYENTSALGQTMLKRASIPVVYLNNCDFSNLTSTQIVQLIEPTYVYAYTGGIDDYPNRTKEIHMNCWNNVPASGNIYLIHTTYRTDSSATSYMVSRVTAYNYIKNADVDVYAYGWSSANIEILKSLFKIHTYSTGLGGTLYQYGIEGIGIIRIWIDATHYWLWSLTSEYSDVKALWQNASYGGSGTFSCTQWTLEEKIDNLTFVPDNTGYILWKDDDSEHKTIEYSIDNGNTWTSVTSTAAGTQIPVIQYNPVQFRSSNTVIKPAKFVIDTNQGTVGGSIYGDVTSMIDYSNGWTQWALYALFKDCVSVTNHPSKEIVLSPSTTGKDCYNALFNGCTGITRAPALPVTTLAIGCYGNMFSGCTGLTESPILPAADMPDYCYADMFSGCSNLNKITCLATSGFQSWNYSRTNWVRGVAATGTFIKDVNATSWPTGNNGIPSGWTVQDAS